jgi:hypothetical protein
VEAKSNGACPERSRTGICREITQAPQIRVLRAAKHAAPIFIPFWALQRDIQCFCPTDGFSDGGLSKTQLSSKKPNFMQIYEKIPYALSTACIEASHPPFPSHKSGDRVQSPGSCAAEIESQIATINKTSNFIRLRKNSSF